MTGELRILTVRNPWAEAIMFAGKDTENRTRNVAGTYRGPIALHAAKRVNTLAEWDAFSRVHIATVGVGSMGPEGCWL